MTPKLKRTLALALAGGSLAIGVPAALAAGGDGDTGSTGAPSSLIQDQQQPDRARPDRDDCPEKDGAQGGGGEQEGSSAGGGTTEAPAI